MKGDRVGHNAKSGLSDAAYAKQARERQDNVRLLPVFRAIPTVCRKEAQSADK
jgi:hypothetical protein